MSFLRSLFCRPARPSGDDAVARPIQDEKTNGSRAANGSHAPSPARELPPANDFLRELAQNPKKPTRELLRPRLKEEVELRKAFARGDSGVHKLANLVALFTEDDQQQQQLKARNIDRELNQDDKYIMSLPSSKLQSEHQLATVSSLDEYRRNFDAFTHNVLRDLDWRNVVAAGSSALLPLLPRRDDIEIFKEPAVESDLEGYYQQVASSSDIDLFVYGLTEKEAVTKIIHIESIIRKNQRLSPDTGMALRTENAITFVSPRWPYRHVQIILRLYASVSEILTGFDVDCACVAYDGRQVFSNPRGVASIATRTNTIDLTRRSPSYESRLFKYRSHNFDVYCDSLDRSKVNLARCTIAVSKPAELKGLARLLFLEFMVEKYGSKRNYQQMRRLRKIQESGSEPTHSGYASHEIPYGERFTATRVRRYIAYRSQEPHVFGTAREVVHEGARKGVLAGPVSFLKDDPGRQMIGSFHPLSKDDWTEMAYSTADDDGDHTSTAS